MAQRMVFEYSATITATGQRNLDAVDLSRANSLRCEIIITGAPGADGTDLLDCYIQNRWRDGVWSDRVHFDQLTGAMSSGEERAASILADGTPLTTIEKEGEPTGSTGASRLAAGTTMNGPLAPRYRSSAGTATGWRVDFQVTTGNAPSFPITVRIYAESDLDD